MRPAVLVLALFGFAAIFWRLFRAGFALARGGVEAFLARETAELRARRGDLTGLHEAEQRRGRARRSRLRATLRVAGWLALLAIPPFTPWAAEVYAACAALWLLPARTRGWGSAPRRRPPLDEAGHEERGGEES